MKQCLKAHSPYLAHTVTIIACLSALSGTPRMLKNNDTHGQLNFNGKRFVSKWKYQAQMMTTTMMTMNIYQALVPNSGHKSRGQL